VTGHASAINNNRRWARIIIKQMRRGISASNQTAAQRRQTVAILTANSRHIHISIGILNRPRRRPSNLSLE
jgi:hypothetical protein